MILPIQYKYKNYPNAPKATAKSRALGMMTSFFPMLLWSFFVVAIFGGLLMELGMPENPAYIVGCIGAVFFAVFVHKWKKKLEQKIDEAAIREILGQR